MTPHFLHVLSNGQLWITNYVNFVPPAGTVVQNFRINSLANSQLLCTLTGSGNASASALAVVAGTSGKTGTAEGNEVH